MVEDWVYGKARPGADIFLLLGWTHANFSLPATAAQFSADMPGTPLAPHGGTIPAVITEFQYV